MTRRSDAGSVGGERPGREEPSALPTAHIRESALQTPEGLIRLQDVTSRSRVTSSPGILATASTIRQAGRSHPERAAVRGRSRSVVRATRRSGQEWPPRMAPTRGQPARPACPPTDSLASMTGTGVDVGPASWSAAGVGGTTRQGRDSDATPASVRRRTSRRSSSGGTVSIRSRTDHTVGLADVFPARLAHEELRGPRAAGP